MMGQAGLWAAAAGLVLALLILARRPLAAAGRLILRSAAGLCCLWVLDQLGAVIGVRVGVNLVSGLVLGVLGAPGLGLLLLAQWALA
jgi:inhibitor of the pro-sigma K processing machinery